MGNVLINSLLLSDSLSGVQYYIRNLLNEFNRIDLSGIDVTGLCPVQYNTDNLCDNNLNVQIPSFNTKNRTKRVLFEHLMIPRSYHKKFDLIHAPGTILPLLWQSKSVLTVHDLVALDYPELCQIQTNIYYNCFLSNSIKRATKIIAVSNKVKEDILSRFKIEEEKIAVIYHGVNSIFRKITNTSEKAQRVKRKYKLPKKYILFVGNIEPRKNLVNLIKAFHKIRNLSDIDHKFVIVGKNGWKNKSLFKETCEDIIFTGYAPEEDLPCLYSLSDLFVFPSLYEGFGIPPLEAMACSVPTLVSNRGALPEITGGFSLEVDPLNIDEIAKGIYHLLTNNNLRKKNIREGEEWAKQFRWDKTARETLKIYQDLINK